MGINIDFSILGVFGILIDIVSVILELLIIYYLFMGIKELSENLHRDIYEEADMRWKQYLMLEIAVMLGIIMVFIPLLNFLYILGMIIASVILMTIIMKFMKKFGENFQLHNYRK